MATNKVGEASPIMWQLTKWVKPARYVATKKESMVHDVPSGLFF